MQQQSYILISLIYLHIQTPPKWSIPKLINFILVF